MISSIVFDRAIPVDLNRRKDRFDQESDPPWSIVEVEPGRISLIEARPNSPNIIVQDVPYTIHVVESEGSSDGRAAEAPAGNPAAAGSIPAPSTKHGRRKP